MIEEIPMDDYDNEACDNDEDDLYNTAFSGEENTYDSTKNLVPQYQPQNLTDLGSLVKISSLKRLTAST